MFNEKEKEYSKKQGKEIPVWISPKYRESKEKALEIIKAYDDVTEGDFWILMNETKSGKMAYTGLIISHNGCLKINDHLEANKKFMPACVTKDASVMYGGSLVYEYCCPEQGLYEVGEASKENCKNAYPYAMAFKRLYDRVVLKNSKLAYSGIYSESESDEFTRAIEANESETIKPITESQIRNISTLAKEKGSDISEICKFFNVGSLGNMTNADYGRCMAMLNSKKGA